MRPSRCCDASRLGHGDHGCDAVLCPLENLVRLSIGLLLADRCVLNRVVRLQVRPRLLDLLRMAEVGGRHAGGRIASDASRRSVWLCR